MCRPKWRDMTCNSPGGSVLLNLQRAAPYIPHCVVCIVSGLRRRCVKAGFWPGLIAGRRRGGGRTGACPLFKSRGQSIIWPLTFHLGLKIKIAFGLSIPRRAVPRFFLGVCNPPPPPGAIENIYYTG